MGVSTHVARLGVALLYVAQAGAELSHVEELFVAVPSADQARAHLKFYTSVAHMAGTIGDHETAKYTAAKFEEYGIEARIEPVQGIILVKHAPISLAPPLVMT